MQAIADLSGDEVVLDLALGVELNGYGVRLLAAPRAPGIRPPHVHRILRHVDLGEGAAVAEVGRHAGDEALPEMEV